MLRKIVSKGAVTRRKLWRSYDRPVAVKFDTTLNALLEAGKIQLNEDKAFVAL